MITIKNKYTKEALWENEANTWIGVTFADANLTNADFRNANFTGFDFTCANLFNADLNGADLTGANLFNTDLTGADLTGADLTGADLTSANLNGANLFNANLSGANLTDANLTGANLSDANLTDANLRGADLSGANLSGADLNDAKLRNADLDGANLSGAKLPPGIIVKNLDKKILQAIESGGNLNMERWHTCKTTHCRAGWAIHLAGKEGRKLEEKVGSQVAGVLIYHSSTGRVPNFFTSDKDALADIRRCAEPSIN